MVQKIIDILAKIQRLQMIVELWCISAVTQELFEDFSPTRKDTVVFHLSNWESCCFGKPAFLGKPLDSNRSYLYLT